MTEPALDPKPVRVSTSITISQDHKDALELISNGHSMGHAVEFLIDYYKKQTEKEK